MRHIGDYFKTTKHFHPGEVKFRKLNVSFPFFEAAEQPVTLSEVESILCLSVIAAIIDDDFAPEEQKAMAFLFYGWPLFDQPEMDMQKTMNGLAEKLSSHGVIACLEASFDTIQAKNRALAYAAISEVVYADRKLHDREFEFLDLIQSRLRIDNTTRTAIDKSALIRYGM